MRARRRGRHRCHVLHTIRWRERLIIVWHVGRNRHWVVMRGILRWRGKGSLEIWSLWMSKHTRRAITASWEVSAGNEPSNIWGRQVDRSTGNLFTSRLNGLGWVIHSSLGHRRGWRCYVWVVSVWTRGRPVVSFVHLPISVSIVVSRHPVRGHFALCKA